MAWRDNLLPGSLDGVPFEIESHDYRFGRRTVSYEFPGRDEPKTRDLGRAQDEFQIEVFVLEPNYMPKRDDLIDAIKKPGPKVLVHPYLGEKVVNTTLASLSESTREGGLARFRITCVETGEEDNTRIIMPETPVVADYAITRIEKDFATNFDPTDFLDSLVGAIQSAATTMRQLKGKIARELAIVSDLDQALQAFRDSVRDLLNTPQELASQLTGLMATLMGLVKLVPDLGSRPGLEPPSRVLPSRVALNTMDTLVAFDGGAPTDISQPRRAKQAENLNAIQALVRRSAIVETARTLGSVPYDSADQAVATLSEFSTTLQDEIENAASDVYTSMENLRASLSQQLRRVAQDLPSITTFDASNRPIPALVLAYQLYGDATREREIVRRNNPANPLTMSGVLEVLSE